MTSVFGIDPSLSQTGLAVISDGKVQVASVKSKGTAGASIHQKLKRVWALSADTEWQLRDMHPEGRYYDFDAGLMEGPAFGTQNGSAHYLAGAWWALAEVGQILLYDDGPSLGTVVPTQLKIYATGKGNANKDQVMLEVARRYGHLCTVENNDQADALVLAALAWHLVTGEPLVDLPQTHTRVLEKVSL